MRDFKKISIVMPCLNEEKSIGICLDKAISSSKKLKSRGYQTEIIVSDNGSSDNSVKIAKKYKVRVVKEPKKGYGAALMKGIRFSKGNYIIMGDCDGSYDFSQIVSFVKELEKGFQIVLGSRLKGDIKHNSMPFTHRYLGTPILTKFINIFYHSNLSDSQTGFRAFTKDAYRKMRLKSTGMEFASEMLIKAVCYKLKIAEIPICYYPRIGKSKLSPLKDAWKHILSIIIYSPMYALLLPGLLFFFFGLIGTFILLPGPLYIKGNLKFDIYTFISCVFLAILGIHIIIIGILTRFYTTNKLGLTGGLLSILVLKYVTLNRLLIVGFTAFALSFLVISFITLTWIANGYSEIIHGRVFVATVGLIIISVQLLSSSLFFKLLQKSE